MPKERILVASSDLDAYQKINKVLKRKIGETIHTKTAIETIAQIEKTAFAAIFIDLDDKKIKDSRIIEKIGAKGDNTIVVLIIPRKKIALLPKIMKTHSYNYLIKPFHPSEINMVLNSAEKTHALSREFKALKTNIKEFEDAIKGSGQKLPSSDSKGGAAEGGPVSLEAFIEERLNRFIKKLNGAKGANFYDMIIAEIEKPLISLALKETRGNQIKAATLLGINRNTLRKKVTELRLSIPAE
jgi:DNA-binding protein Fis/ActR/RegA family two-component response regulator